MDRCFERTRFGSLALGSYFCVMSWTNLHVYRKVDRSSAVGFTVPSDSVNLSERETDRQQRVLFSPPEPVIRLNIHHIQSVSQKTVKNGTFADESESRKDAVNGDGT